MWPNPQIPADLVTFTEEILSGKFIFWAMVLVQRSPDTPERLERPLDINVKKDLQQSVLTWIS